MQVNQEERLALNDLKGHPGGKVLKEFCKHGMDNGKSLLAKVIKDKKDIATHNQMVGRVEVYEAIYRLLEPASNTQVRG